MTDYGDLMVTDFLMIMVGNNVPLINGQKSFTNVKNLHSVNFIL